MRQLAFLVVRPQLSSSNRNFSKPRSRTANADFWSRLTHQLLGRLKSAIPSLPIVLPKKGKFWEVGVGDWQSMQDSFSWVCGWTSTCRGLMTGIFWNPGVFSYAMIPRCRPNERVFFFFIVASIVYGEYWALYRRWLPVVWFCTLYNHECEQLFWNHKSLVFFSQIIFCEKF